jgi:hypothetical protein
MQSQDWVLVVGLLVALCVLLAVWIVFGKEP